MAEEWTPAPRRGVCLSRGRWGIGFYKVGLSWVALLKAPRLGLIHLSHYVWWKPLALMPRAIVGNFRLMSKR